MSEELLDIKPMVYSKVLTESVRIIVDRKLATLRKVIELRRAAREETDNG